MCISSRKIVNLHIINICCPKKWGGDKTHYVPPLQKVGGLVPLSTLWSTPMMGRTVQRNSLHCTHIASKSCVMYWEDPQSLFQLVRVWVRVRDRVKNDNFTRRQSDGYCKTGRISQYWAYINISFWLIHTRVRLHEVSQICKIYDAKCPSIHQIMLYFSNMNGAFALQTMQAASVRGGGIYQSLILVTWWIMCFNAVNK